MPKIAINWETASVSFYKFVCKDPSILYSYVGHTTSFSRRKSQHKSSCANQKDKAHNFPLYVFIRENGNWINWDMVQIKSQICKDSLHARQIEQELLEQQHFKLNAMKAYVSIEQTIIRHTEYRKQHKEEIAKYRKENKKQTIIRNAEYYKQNKEQFATKAVEYREKNREHLNKTSAEYRKQHKEELAKYNAEYYRKRKQLLKTYETQTTNEFAQK